MDLKKLAAAAGERSGTVWTLEGSGELNANLLRFPTGRGIEEHVNEEVDVILVGVAGTGRVVVDKEEHRLSAGDLVFVRRGARRSLRSASDDFAYLSVHRRRGPIRPGSKEGAERPAEGFRGRTSYAGFRSSRKER